MGFLSDLMGGGGSHSQTTQSTNTSTNTQLAGGNIQAPTVYGSGNRVSVVDPGAVALAGKVGLASIASGVATSTEISRAAVAMGANALQANAGVTANALDFGTSAVGAVSRSNDTIAKFSNTALDSMAQLFTTATASNAGLLDQSVGAISGLASQVSQSATQSVNNSIVKLVTIIAMAAAAVFILKGAK